MAESTHRSRKLGALGVLLILAFVGVVAIDAYQKLRKQPGPPSTYNAGSEGYKALYLWLREMGVSAERWEKPLTDLTREADVLVMITPKLGVGKGELEALETWVRGGGTLVLALDTRTRVRGILVPAASPGNSTAKHFGFDLKMSFQDQKKEEKALSLQPGPYIRGPRKIVGKTDAGVDSKNPQAIVHARDAFGNLIVVLEEGKGRVIMVVEPSSLFSNLHLREGDHGRLALDLLLTHLGSGRLLIDEYHHGYGRVTSVAAYVFQSETFVPLMQILFLFLLIWAAAGRRFGPARPLRREVERFSMEYVRAVAHLYQRVKAKRLSLESLLRWFDEETRRLLLDRDPVFQKELEEAKKHLAQESMTDRDLVHAVRKLYGALAKAKKGRS
jgi:hypothetical protein